MAFSFLIEDTNMMDYRVTIDNEGSAVITEPGGKELDHEYIAGLEALGMPPGEVWQNFDATWKYILKGLDKTGELSGFLEEIEANGTQVQRWVGYGKYALGGHYKNYTFEFDLGSFAAYMGSVMLYNLENLEGDIAVDIANLIKAARKPDGTGFKFTMEDDGWTESEGGSELIDKWSCISRTIYADDTELFEYCVDFVRSIYDPITLDSEANPLDEHGLTVASSHSLQKIISIFGLEKKQETLNNKAADNAPEPAHPDPDEEGEWGVYYRYIRQCQDKKSGEFFEEERQVVVPYWSKQDAADAFGISKEFASAFAGVPIIDFYIVRRISEEDEEMREAVAKEREKERRFFKKQGRLFDIDTPPPITFDPELDVWEKWQVEDAD